jgi:hypothetical protein
MACYGSAQVIDPERKSVITARRIDLAQVKIIHQVSGTAGIPAEMATVSPV